MFRVRAVAMGRDARESELVGRGYGVAGSHGAKGGASSISTEEPALLGGELP